MVLSFRRSVNCWVPCIDVLVLFFSQARLECSLDIPSTPLRWISLILLYNKACLSLNKIWIFCRILFKDQQRAYCLKLHYGLNFTCYCQCESVCTKMKNTYFIILAAILKNYRSPCHVSRRDQRIWHEDMRFLFCSMLCYTCISLKIYLISYWGICVCACVCACVRAWASMWLVVAPIPSVFTRKHHDKRIRTLPSWWGLGDVIDDSVTTA